MDLELRGKSVLIAGASTGIGLACARGFAAEGANVHLSARFDISGTVVPIDGGAATRPRA
jgi:NAD(P)-dependent dehydrogenase (short-subunit alcohol dehydrogenase family)